MVLTREGTVDHRLVVVASLLLLMMMTMMHRGLVVVVVVVVFVVVVVVVWPIASFPTPSWVVHRDSHHNLRANAPMPTPYQ